MAEPMDWQRAWTFEAYIISLFEKKQTDSLEFKVMLRIFGREKLEKIWFEYKAKGKHHEHYPSGHESHPKQDSTLPSQTEKKKDWIQKAGSFASRSLPDDDF